MPRNIDFKRTFLVGLLCAFILNVLGPLPSRAEEFYLPKPGQMVHLSLLVNPPLLKGIKVHPDNPFMFDFILDQGSRSVADAHKLKEESSRLIKYFLASLTTPEADLWVNLSPYEKNRIVPESFGQTEMGRDLLAQDYMLKQITASLMYPEEEIGRKFWKRIYEESAKRYGTTNIPVNTFNKVWIVPEKAVVYENAKAGTAYVVESRLKVMLEEDYVASKKVSDTFLKGRVDKKVSDTFLHSQIIREVVIPELTKEINEGANFVQLRQVYSSLILATWYKKKIKDSILAQVYVDKNKIVGVGSKPTQDRAGLEPAPTDIELIYQQYLQSFKKGVYNYIKEESDPLTKQPVPRKYFSGGVNFFGDLAMSTINQLPNSVGPKNLAIVGVQVRPVDERTSGIKNWDDVDIEGSLRRLLKVEEREDEGLDQKIKEVALFMSKATIGRSAVMRQVLNDFVDTYGIKMELLPSTTKKQLLTIVIKITGQQTYEVWTRFIQEITRKFGIDIQEIEEGQKQQLLTAGLYVALGKKNKKEGVVVSDQEEVFNDFLVFVKETFGISEEELRLKETEGGLKLSEKFQMIVAGYHVSLGKAEGLNTFKETIKTIRETFGISEEELRLKETEGGLKLSEKFQMIVAGYQVSLGKAEGLNTFKETIKTISRNIWD